MPVELRDRVRRVYPRGVDWWALVGVRLFVLPVVLLGAGMMVASMAWAWGGTDHSARLVRAWSGPGKKGRTVYRATYVYRVDGRERHGSSPVSAGTYLRYRGAPGEPHGVRVRSIGWPPVMYDEVIDMPGQVGREAGLGAVLAGLFCVLGGWTVYEFYVTPWRVKGLHRAGVPVLGELGSGRVERGKGTRYVLDYRFTADDGREWRGETVVRRKQFEGMFPGAAVWVLYDPARPGRNVLYGVGAYECRVERGG